VRGRMLKKAVSCVLASFRPSTYPRGYASALHSLRPCWPTFLIILQERVTSLSHSLTLQAESLSSRIETGV